MKCVLFGVACCEAFILQFSFFSSVLQRKGFLWEIMLFIQENQLNVEMCISIGAIAALFRNSWKPI